MICVNRNVITIALLLALFSLGCDDGTEDPLECTQEDTNSCIESCNGEGYDDGGVISEEDCSCVCVGQCTTRAATYTCQYWATEGDCPQSVIDGVFNSQCEITFDGTEVCGPWEAEMHEYDSERQCDMWVTFRGEAGGYGINNNFLDIALICPDIDCHHTFRLSID
jgi:hypothetical protein